MVDLKKNNAAWKYQVHQSLACKIFSQKYIQSEIPLKGYC